MDNYFNEDNAVKFDLQNGKIETLCFCRDKHLAKEIALALNKYNDEDDDWYRNNNSIKMNKQIERRK